MASRQKEEELGQSGRLALTCILAFAVLQLAFQLWPLTLGTRFLVSHLAVDDTFYYLQTAWSTAENGFATFDGLHRTNGVQLLWFLVLWIVAIFAPTKAVLMYAALTLCVFLNVSCYSVIWRIGRALSRPWLATWMASLWMAVSLHAIYSRGLENSLHGLVFWWLAYQLLLFLIALKGKEESPSLTPLTIALVFNAWVRLDGGLFSAIIFVGCLSGLWLRTRRVAHFGETHARNVTRSLLVAMAGCGILLCTYWAMAGTALPISAMVKSSGLHYPNELDGLTRLADAFVLSMPPRFRPPLANTAALLAFGALGFFWLRVGWPRPIEFWVMWAVLLAAVGSYHIVIAVREVTYTRYLDWYRSPMFIFWILTFGGLSIEVLDRFRGRREVIAVVGALALSVVVATVSLSRFHQFAVVQTQSRSYTTGIYERALWVANNSPPETVFAAWNAGILAYFSDRTFINLDGLVNSRTYFEEVLSNSDVEAATSRYLEEENVDYILDVAVTPEAIAITKALTHVRSFASDGSAEHGWQLWRVRPNALPLHVP